MMKKIRSSNLSKLIFSHIDERQKLKLVKCNKSLQRKIDISLINYKLFSGKYLLYESNIKVKEFNIINNILIFEGVYLNGKRNGLGKEYYNNGKLKFEGKFLNGKRNGKGKEYYNSGALKFDGEYLNNKILIGTLYDENGYIIHEYNNINGIKKEYDYNGTLIFEGEYSNGERNGKGKEYNYNGLLKFEGNYIDGKRNGYGKEYDDNYLIFEGIYFNDKKWEGKGYNILKNFVYQLKGGRGSIKEYNKGELKFEGDYVNGERNGMGKEYNDKGELIFEGEYLNGLKNGKGKEYHDNGELKFEGHYLYNHKLKGREYNNELLEYEGEYFNELRSGKGKEYYNNNLILEGEMWCDMIWNGKLKEYNKEGKFLYKSEYKNLKIWNGREIIDDIGWIMRTEKFKGKSILKGESINKQKNRKGKELFKGKLIFEGNYLNEKRNGYGIEYNFDGGKFLGDFKNGLKWEGTGYNKNGEIEYEIIDGYGYIKEYHNGILIYEGQYLKGKRNGNGREFCFLTRKLKYEGVFINGKKLNY